MTGWIAEEDGVGVPTAACLLRVPFGFRTDPNGSRKIILRVSRGTGIGEGTGALRVPYRPERVPKEDPSGIAGNRQRGETGTLRDPDRPERVPKGYPSGIAGNPQQGGDGDPTGPVPTRTGPERVRLGYRTGPVWVQTGTKTAPGAVLRRPAGRSASHALQAEDDRRHPQGGAQAGHDRHQQRGDGCGSIIIAVAVLESHMESSAVDTMKPIASRLGLVPSRSMTVRRAKSHKGITHKEARAGFGADQEAPAGCGGAGGARHPRVRRSARACRQSASSTSGREPEGASITTSAP